MPGFLAWQLNQKPVQDHLQTLAAGTSQKGITARGLCELGVVVPPLSEQSEIVSLHAAHVREREVYNRLIENRNLEVEAIACDLVRKYSEEGRPA